jgi:hypothetical protein
MFASVSRKTTARALLLTKICGTVVDENMFAPTVLGVLVWNAALVKALWIWFCAKAAAR